MAPYKKKKKKKTLKPFDLERTPYILPLIRRQNTSKCGGKDQPDTKQKESLLYEGVRRCKGGTKWKARILIDGQKCSLGKFESEEDAALTFARAKWSHDHAGSHREVVGGMDLTDVPKTLPLLPPAKKNTKACYKGIFKVGKSNRWRSYITFKGKNKNLRSHNTPKEAALLAARAQYYLQSLRPKDVYGGLDLSQTPTDLNPVDNNQPSAVVKPYQGIETKGDRWCAHVFVDGRKKHLGTFDTSEEAGKIHARAMYHLGWVPRTSTRNGSHKASGNERSVDTGTVTGQEKSREKPPDREVSINGKRSAKRKSVKKARKKYAGERKGTDAKVSRKRKPVTVRPLRDS